MPHINMTRKSGMHTAKEEAKEKWKWAAAIHFAVAAAAAAVVVYVFSGSRAAHTLFE